MFYRYFMYLLVTAVAGADDADNDGGELDGDDYEENARSAGALPSRRQYGGIFRTTVTPEDPDQDVFVDVASNEWNDSINKADVAATTEFAPDFTTKANANAFITANGTNHSITIGEDLTTMPKERAIVTTRTTTEDTAYMNEKETVPDTTPWPGRDFTSHNDREHLYLLAKELYGEIMVQVRTSYRAARMYEESFGFEIGSMVALMTLRYRLMMELWRELLSLEERWGNPPRSRIWPLAWTNPNLWFVSKHRERASGYYFVMYDFIHEIEKDIEKLVDMLLDIPRTDMSLKTLTVNMRLQTTLSPGTFSRKWRWPQTSHGPRTSRKGRRFMLRSKDEEQYKSRVREQFLLRRLGMNESLHTPKPRFIRGWPVEETWDNLDYINQ